MAFGNRLKDAVKKAQAAKAAGAKKPAGGMGRMAQAVREQREAYSAKPKPMAKKPATPVAKKPPMSRGIPSKSGNTTKTQKRWR